MDPLQRDKPYRKTLVGRSEAALSAFVALLRRTGAGSIAIAIGMLGAGALLATTLIFPPAPVQQVFQTPVADDVLSTPFERPSSGSIRVDTDDEVKVAAKDDAREAGDPVGTEVLGEFISKADDQDPAPLLGAPTGRDVKLDTDGAQPGGKANGGGSGSGGEFNGGSPWNQGSGGPKVGSGKSGDGSGGDGADLSSGGSKKPPKPSGWGDDGGKEDDDGWGSKDDEGPKKEEPKQIEQSSSPGSNEPTKEDKKAAKEAEKEQKEAEKAAEKDAKAAEKEQKEAEKEQKKAEKAAEKASKDENEVKVETVDDDDDDSKDSKDSESSASSDSDD